MTALVLIETVLLAVLAVLVTGLLRAYGTVLRRLHDLDVGGPRPPGHGGTPGPSAADAAAELGPAHDVAGQTLTGELVTIRVAGVAHDTLLLFLSSGCSTCQQFWTDLATPGAWRLPPGVRLLVVTQDAEEESPRTLAALAPEGVDVVLSSQAWLDYAVPGSPYAVFAGGPDGRVRGEGTGQSLGQVADLLARATGDPGFVTGAPLPKSRRDREHEIDADRELLAAGVLPGDARLYGAAE